VFVRERTPLTVILYGVYLVFEGLSLRAASRALRLLAARSHVSIWRWVQGPALWRGSFWPGGLDASS